MSRLCVLMGCILGLGESALMASDLEELADLVFKGRREFTEEEISEVFSKEEWQEHHRVILGVQMLASVDDEDRFERAIEKATAYIEEDPIPWVREYLRVNRAFLYNLRGDRKTGAEEMETLLEERSFRGLDRVDDPLVHQLKKYHRNLEAVFSDLMRQSLGFYYLDSRKEGRLPQKAYDYFSAIRAEGNRKECMYQLKMRLGDAFESLDRSAEVPEDPPLRDDRSEKRDRGEPRQDPARNPKAVPSDQARDEGEEEVASKWPFIAAGGILVLALGVLFQSRRGKRG